VSLLLAAAGCSERVDPIEIGLRHQGPRPLAHDLAARASNPKNLVIVSLDTLRADHVLGYGFPKPTTPNLDRLAAEGASFDQAYSHSPHTAQSHMSAFTSLYPSEHGVHNYSDGDATRLDDRVPTLARILQASGYRTHAVVSGGNISGALGFDAGFDQYEELENAARRVFARALKVLGEFERSTQVERAPFFLFVHTYEIHDPYVSGAEYHEIFCDPDYRGGVIDSREELDRLTTGMGYQQAHRVYWDAVDRDRAEDIQRVRCLYEAGIRVADHHLGTLLDELTRIGLVEDTAIVVFSDHGEEFDEHGRFNHEQLYQELLHVPLVVRLPGSKTAAGSRIPDRVRLIDLLPTLTDYLGLPTPNHVQGASMLPLLRGEQETDRPVVAEYRKRGLSSLALGEWKLISRPPHVGQRRVELGRWAFQVERRRNPSELFHLSVDPGEREDLARGKSGRLLAMQTRLDTAIDQFRQMNAALAGEQVDLDSETLQQLEALGYVDP
jgi:arylsulfatase A-like enzyme